MDNNSKVQLRIGDIVIATITRVLKTHIEMSLDGTYAIMPTSEYSWTRSNKLGSGIKVGRSIKAVVIMMEYGVVVLSVKRLEEDPWKSIDEIYKIGDQVTGRVKKVLDYGAFIELNNNVNGLLHKTNINCNAEDDIRTVVSEGQEIVVNIISIDKQEHRISLSMIKD